MERVKPTKEKDRHKSQESQMSKCHGSQGGQVSRKEGEVNKEQQPGKKRGERLLRATGKSRAVFREQSFQRNQNMGI